MKDYSMYTYYKGSDTFPNKKAKFWGTYEKMFDNSYSGKAEDKEDEFKNYISHLLYQISSDSVSMGGSATFEMIQEEYGRNIKHYLNESDGIERYER